MINVSRSGQHHDYLPQAHTSHTFNGRHGTVGGNGEASIFKSLCAEEILL